MVSQFSLRLFPDVLSRFSPSYLPLNPHNTQLSSKFSPPMISQLLSNCFRAVSQMWSSNCLPIVSLSLEFETVAAVGLQSWVNCVRLSGCLSLLPCVSHGLLVPDPLDFSPFQCLPLWLMVSALWMPLFSWYSIFLFASQSESC